MQGPTASRQRTRVRQPSGLAGRVHLPLVRLVAHAPPRAGFGRIGRLVMRATLERDDVEVVAINDLIDANYMR